MQFSLMTYTVGPGQPGGLPHVTAIADFAAEVGFAALELSAGHLTDMSPADFGAMCADHDLAVSCINGGCPMTSADDAAFQAGVDQAKSYVDWAAAMDCPVIMLLPGPALNEADKERTRHRIAEGLNLVMAHANGAGIIVTLEDFPNPLTPYCSIADLQWMFANVPGLQLTFDNGNFMLGGDDPLTALQTLGDAVANVHVKDWEINPAGQGMRLPDGRFIRGGRHGRGLIEHQPIFAELVKQGYDGYLAFEYEGPLDHCEATRDGLAYLREVLAEVESAKAANPRGQSMATFKSEQLRRQLAYRDRMWPRLGGYDRHGRTAGAYRHILPVEHRLWNAFPPVAEAIDRYFRDEQIAYHSDAHNLLSSQMCCLNFLFPLRQDLGLARKVLGGMLPGVTSVQAVEFEYTGPHGGDLAAWLGEEQQVSRGQNQTSIDAAIRWRRGDEAHLTLCEWKYTEPGYGACGGYVSPGNTATEVCDTFLTLGLPRERCYLQARKARRYWEHLDAAGLGYDKLSCGACPLRGPFYQLMRQYLFARYMQQTDTARVHLAAISFECNDKVHQVDGHRGRAEEVWNSALSEGPPFQTYTAEQLAARIRSAGPAAPEGWADYLHERYGV